MSKVYNNHEVENIKFEFSFEIYGDKVETEEDAIKLLSVPQEALNPLYIRLEDDLKSSETHFNSNSGFWSKNDKLHKSTTPAHELTHMLGLLHPSWIGETDKAMPNDISLARGEIENPKKRQLTPYFFEAIMQEQSYIYEDGLNTVNTIRKDRPKEAINIENDQKAFLFGHKSNAIFGKNRNLLHDETKEHLPIREKPESFKF